MALPLAQKDIRENPAPNSVAEPIDRTKLQADIDRKVRLYGIFAALQQSRLPTNAQLNEFFEYSLTHSPVPLEELSPDGQKLIQDSRDIISTMRQLIMEKNSDELLQNFIWHTRDVSLDGAKKDPNEVLPIDQQKARDDSQQAMHHLRTLLSLIFTNSEVRKLFGDFSVIGRDLLARGAGKVAEVARPDDSRLQSVDDPAPNNQFVTEGGRTVGPDETPVPEVRVPGTNKRVAQHPREEFGTGATVKSEDGEELSGEEAFQRAQQQKAEFQDRATSEAQRQKDEFQDAAGGDVVPDDSEDAQGKAQGIRSKISDFKNSISDRIPSEHKDRANEHYSNAKRFLTDEYFPPERRDQFIYRGKKVIIECQNHDDYQESVQWLLNFLEEYAQHSRKVVDSGKDSHQQLISDPALQQAMTELRTLLERFANGMSLDVIGNAMRDLNDDAANDEDLRRWFKDVDSFIRDVLLKPGYVLDDECNGRGNSLREYGRRFYDEKYKNHFDNLFSSISDWFGAFAQDPLNKNFGASWAQLTRDLLTDSDGNMKYKPELWMDIRKVILPNIIAEIGYFPIPRIEYTDDSFDLVVENLALSGRNIFPNIVDIETHNSIKFSPYNSIADQSHHEFTLKFAQIQADMRDVAFYYRKKTGMPKMTDAGLADVLLGGQGLTVTAHIVSSDKDKSSVFKVKNVDVAVGTLKFAIRDSKHDTLYKTLRPLVTGLIKKKLQSAIAGAVTTALEYVDGQLVAVRDQMNEAKASEDSSRTQVLKEQIFGKKEEAQAKTQETNAQFKVVKQPEEKILNEGHPAGWINRTEERVELASKGEEWKSAAYNLDTNYDKKQ